jgi:hypothetical protein
MLLTKVCTFHYSDCIEEIAFAESTCEMRLEELCWETVVWRDPFRLLQLPRFISEYLKGARECGYGSLISTKTLIY